MDDEKLVIKAQNGDKEAFTSLIQKYKKEMYCIAKSRLDTEVDIDDAIQETLYKAYVNIRRLKDPKYFKTWIIRILYNNCSDITRSDKAKIIPFEDKIMDSIPDDHDAYLDIANNCDFFELINSLTDEEKTLIQYCDDTGPPDDGLCFAIIHTGCRCCTIRHGTGKCSGRQHHRRRIRVR